MGCAWLPTDLLLELLLLAAAVGFRVLLHAVRALRNEVLLKAPLDFRVDKLQESLLPKVVVEVI